MRGVAGVLSPDVARTLAWWKDQRAGDAVEEDDEIRDARMADELVIGLDLHEGSRWLRGDADRPQTGHGDLGLAGVKRSTLFERSGRYDSTISARRS
jgi:hypothetical protein